MKWGVFLVTGMIASYLVATFKFQGDAMIAMRALNKSRKRSRRYVYRKVALR